MSLVGHWEEAKFPAGINLVQTMAPGWRQIVSEVALDLITIPVVSALGAPGAQAGRGICALQRGFVRARLPSNVRIPARFWWHSERLREAWWHFRRLRAT